MIVDWGGLEFAVLRHNVFQGSGGMVTSKLRDGVRTWYLYWYFQFMFFFFNLSIKIILKQKCTIDYFWCVI